MENDEILIEARGLSHETCSLLPATCNLSFFLHSLDAG